MKIIFISALVSRSSHSSPLLIAEYDHCSHKSWERSFVTPASVLFNWDENITWKRFISNRKTDFVKWMSNLLINSMEWKEKKKENVKDEMIFSWKVIIVGEKESLDLFQFDDTWRRAIIIFIPEENNQIWRYKNKSSSFLFFFFLDVKIKYSFKERFFFSIKDWNLIGGILINNRLNGNTLLSKKRLFRLIWRIFHWSILGKEINESYGWSIYLFSNEI